MVKLMARASFLMSPIIVLSACTSGFEGAIPSKTCLDAGQSHASENREWFERVQRMDGGWEGSVDHVTSVGVSGLALLTFSARALSDIRGSLSETSSVSRGLAFLMRNQDDRGLLAVGGQSSSLRDHAIAALALSENLRLNPKHQALRRAVSRAAEFSRGRQLGDLLWPSRVDSSTSDAYASAWILVSLWSAFQAGIVQDRKLLEEAAAALSQVDPGISTDMSCSELAKKAAVRYVQALFAEGRTGAGLDDCEMSALLADLISDRKTSGALVGPAYWYFQCATLRLLNRSEHHTDREGRVGNIIAEGEVVRGAFAGSWYVPGRWARRSGRNYTTAMFLLAFQNCFGFTNCVGVISNGDG